jgi:transposase InsO family protein
MNDAHMRSIEDIRKFLQGNEKVDITIESQKEKYEWIGTVVRRFGYRKERKKNKSLIKRYIGAFTGYSDIQIKRLVKRYYEGKLTYSLLTRKRNSFARKYVSTDIALLITTDILHGCLSGQATKEILRREYAVFGNKTYENISHLSSSHIYNLRNHNRQYNSSEAKFFTRTHALERNIGVRRKPQPEGKPGYLRIDTVHQGDSHGVKGMYHINIVDEVTQYEMIASVEKISEQYLRPIIEELLALFPFCIFEFHSDNGSEYINHVVAKLLNKLHIELTKSRSHHSNDNALVESKNGSIIRKLYGRNFIDAKFAPLVNEFNRTFVNAYLNYHRPCGFSTLKIDRRGKKKKKYDMYLTPYEKLKSLPNAATYLKEGFSFAVLDTIAYGESDNTFAERMKKAKQKLFKKLTELQV